MNLPTLENFAPNFTRVDLGDMTLWFSYKTLVAFMVAHQGLVIRENRWGKTTGKHLNLIDSRKERRVDSETFQKLWDERIEQTAIRVV